MKWMVRKAREQVQALKPWWKGVKKEIQAHTPWREQLFHKYNYNFSPAQLRVLMNQIEQVREIPGIILEVGCAGGNTTVFLQKFMKDLGIEKEYICLDTFSGFTAEDIRFEKKKRKKGVEFLHGFRANKKTWFDETMLRNQVSVRAIQGDANHFDFSALGPIAFCLLDVDIYNPAKNTLNGIVPIMSPGGIVVMDDCKPGTEYDGSYQAYMEFVKETNRTPELVFRKLGVLRF